MRATRLMSLAIMLLMSCFLLVGCYTNPSVPAGYEGYVRENPRVWGNGGYQGSIVGPGNFGISIWNNEVEAIDMRPNTYSETFNILTKDELNVAFRFQMIMKLKNGSVKDIVEKFGGVNYYVRYIKEPYRSFVRKNVQDLESRQVKESRDTIAKNVMAEMNVYLKDTPFILISGVVGNIDYPDVVTKAVEKKLAAKQLLDEKLTQREIAKKDAEIRIEEAKGIAKAQKIINSTLTKNYLQHEAIQAQRLMAGSPNHTTVYIPVGDNGIPLMRTIK